MYILPSIKGYPSIWSCYGGTPSENLCSLCQDNGVIQSKHTDLDRLIMTPIDDKLMPCYNNECGNCIVWGFPCNSAGVREMLLLATG